MWVIEYYVAADGACPTKEFLDGLHKEKELPYVNRMIGLLADMGYNLRRPHSDMLEDGIYELRIRLQRRQFRILYFYFYQDKIILSHGLKKKKCHRQRLKRPRRINWTISHDMKEKNETRRLSF